LGEVDEARDADDCSVDAAEGCEAEDFGCVVPGVGWLVLFGKEEREGVGDLRHGGVV
jgi:hypothetical protein